MDTYANSKRQKEKLMYDPDTTVQIYTTKHHPHVPPNPSKQQDPLLHDLGKLKSLLKEKEMTILKLREENVVLKQIERRHEKKLFELEEKGQDAPRLIQALREELNAFKNKLKENYSQQLQKDRRLRILSEKNEKGRLELSELRRLVEAQDLRMRNELQVEIESSIAQLQQKDIQLQENNRKCELLEKNFASESKNLRSKIASLERENNLFNDRIGVLESTVRERDKEIATLSVYKYNALHRKPDPCRSCQKRMIEEKELERRRKCIEKLPRLTKPRAKIIDPTLVIVEVNLPVLSSVCNYELVKLYCSSKSSISSPLTFDLSPIDEVASVELRDLQVGEYYMVKVAPFIEDMKGEDSEIEAFVVDILPSTPPPPVVTYQVNGQNSKIILKLFENMTASGGTPTYVHRLYHAANNRSEFHLLTELEPENMEYVMHHPELAVLHYFRVTSVNQLGESDPSEIAGPCIIDFPPSRPSPPIVKRDSIQSVLLKINPPASIGESPVTKYLIVGHLNNSPDPLFSLEVSKLSIILEDLSLGTEYVFAVSAMNSAGWSPQSRFSEVICLEKLLPIPPSPQCIILSPTTVRCLLYTSMENEVCPPCTGYKLWLSRTSDLSDNETVCPFLPTQKDMPSVYLLENLEIGGNYWVSVSLIGVSQESALSPPVYLCLAAAIPLPSTPSSPPSSAVTTPKPTNLLRATSRSIELTVSQRIQNMFKGNPAFAIPDDVKAQADADGVKLLVKTSSKSYESLNNSCKREQSSQQSFYHEKSPPVQHNPIEKRTSYSGKKIKDPIKSKTGLNEKK